MAQTKRRRRRKRRGTQSGSVDRGRRGARPRTRQEARARARTRAVQKRDLPPTWGGAVARGLFGAALFGLLLLVAFGQPAGEAIGLSALMLGVYIPMGYYIERFFWRRRQARRLRRD